MIITIKTEVIEVTIKIIIKEKTTAGNMMIIEGTER